MVPFQIQGDFDYPPCHQSEQSGNHHFPHFCRLQFLLTRLGLHSCGARRSDPCVLAPPPRNPLVTLITSVGHRYAVWHLQLTGRILSPWGDNRPGYGHRKTGHDGTGRPVFTGAGVHRVHVADSNDGGKACSASLFVRGAAQW